MLSRVAGWYKPSRQQFLPAAGYFWQPWLLKEQMDLSCYTFRTALDTIKVSLLTYYSLRLISVSPWLQAKRSGRQNVAHKSVTLFTKQTEYLRIQTSSQLQTGALHYPKSAICSMDRSTPGLVDLQKVKRQLEWSQVVHCILICEGKFLYIFYSACSFNPPSCDHFSHHGT